MANSREQRAFLELLRCRYGTGDALNLASVLKRCSAQGLYALIAESGVGGLVCEVCERPDVAAVLPQELNGLLQRLPGIIALNNELVGIAANEVLTAFNAQNIPYILLKGISTARRIYGGDSLRQTSDIDVLLTREDFAQARPVIEALGFEYSQEYLDATGVVLDEQAYLESNNEAPFVRSEGPFTTGLDVHFELGGFQAGSPLNALFPINRTDWFAHTATMDMDGCPARCLTIEAALFYMMCHFSLHHSFMGVKWLVDFCEAVHRLNGEIDWAKIDGLASNSNLRRIVGCCLRLASELTGVRCFGGYDAARFAKRVPVRYLLNRLFDEQTGGRAILTSRITRLMLPATLRDRCRLLAIYLFHSSTAAVHIRTKKAAGFDLLQPVKLAAYAVKRRFFQ